MCFFGMELGSLAQATLDLGRQNEAMMILLMSRVPQEALFVVSPAKCKWATLCFCARALLRYQLSGLWPVIINI
jgi:hypothetical protein